MADVQKQFNQFHEDIKLSNENDLLREKRDILKANLEEGLRDVKDAPSIHKFLLQGSYSTYMGINSPDGDYDIDVGVVFDCTKDDIGAMSLKNMVRDALDRSNRTPVIKNPCITTQYSKNGEPSYHVDMPIYVKRQDGHGYDLAWGKSSSSEDWRHNDPVGLVDIINGKYLDEYERAQFRRLVKYTKTWKNNKCKSLEVPSIGLCLAVMDCSSPQIDFFDKSANDLLSLRLILDHIIDRFTWAGFDNDENALYRLTSILPVVPGVDVFAELTDRQMTDLKTKMESFRDALVCAEDEERVDSACKSIAKHLPDFPVPDKSATAKAAAISLNNTGSSS